MHKLRYMALGGLLMFIGMLTASVLMPSLVAQRDKFGEIECTGLRVVDSEGDAVIVFSTNQMDVVRMLVSANTGQNGNKPEVWIISGDNQAGVHVFGDNGKGQARLYAGEDGGQVDIWGSDRKLKATVNGDNDEQGGQVAVFGNDHASEAVLKIDHHGGVLRTYGRTQGSAAMGINQYGNGAVTTWDKNGYRQ